MKEYKVILSAKVAKILLHKGFTIADIKGDKNNKDKTVFVFHNSEALEKALREQVKEGDYYEQSKRSHKASQRV